MSHPEKRLSRAGSGSRAALEAVQERITRMVGDTFSGHRGRSSVLEPDADLSETAEGWVLEVGLPGVAPDELAIDITDRELTVRPQGPDEELGQASELTPGYAGTRRWSGFRYRMTVPATVDIEAIDATMDHGLLTVRLPRSAAAQSRRITVGRGGTGQPAGHQPVAVSSQVGTAGAQTVAPYRPEADGQVPGPGHDPVGFGQQQAGYRGQQPGRTLDEDPGRSLDRPGFDPDKDPMTRQDRHDAEFNPTTETLHPADERRRT